MCLNITTTCKQCEKLKFVIRELIKELEDKRPVTMAKTIEALKESINDKN